MPRFVPTFDLVGWDIFAYAILMKALLHSVAALLLASCLSSCLFNEAIFTNGFATPDISLAGVWVTEDETGDPRGREFAVVAPVGNAYMLNYPANARGSSYFEAQPLKIDDQDVWQLRLAVTFEDGLPKADSPLYTLLLVENKGPNKIEIRALKNEGEHTVSAAATRKAMEGKSSEWTKLFGEPKIFTRLPNR